MMLRSTLVAAVLTATTAIGLSSCANDTASDPSPASAPAPDPDYGSAREAPVRSDLKGIGSDETPYAEDALVEVDLDNGAVAALWIDLDDIAKVFVQYSDPKDDDSWTAPALVYEAGDGCLIMKADSSGTTIAVGLGCYETDAFIQQAPDEGVALISTDFETWEEKEVGESIPVPEVSEEGDSVVFRNELYDDEVDARWERGGGF